MSRIISASIDLAKIDKSRIRSNGAAKYYDIQIFVNDNANQYGQDVGIAEGQTKEERAANQKRNYIGNGKTVYNSEHVPQQQYEQTKQIQTTEADGDPLPF